MTGGVPTPDAVSLAARLAELGMPGERLAELLEVAPGRVEAWLAGSETPPPAVFRFLEAFGRIRHLGPEVGCRVPGA